VSNRVDLQEFLGAYLAEAEEQLSIANAALLQIEASLRLKESNPRAVRELFRALHTVKGLSAMVGVEPIVALAHRMESSLRAADRGGGRLSSEAVDTLLRGVRAIEQRLRALAEKKAVLAPPRALLDELDALDLSGSPAPRESVPTVDLDPSLATKLAPFQLEALSAPSTDGTRALRVDFVPSPARADKGLSINSVRERVGAIAEIVKVVPLSVPRSPDAPGGISFALLLRSSATDAAIASAVGVEPGQVIALGGASSVAVREEGAGSSSRELADDEASSALQRRSIVRVDVQRLDDAMEQLSSLIVTRSRLARVASAMTETGANTRDLMEIVRENTRQLRDLRAAILRVRMVPVSEVLDRVPLIVRGLRRESGKLVRLVIDAGSAELDKSVAERVFPAIVHIVRNAMDHAVESPDERERVGKPREATLDIRCTAHSNTRLELSISDDGLGVDRALVAKKAGREIGNTDTALLDALCEAGLSTRAEASTTSGRGMGMDIVKRIIVGQLGGELLMRTQPGRGTTFTLRVPLTIAIVDAFTLDCGGQTFVVPVSMVEEILEIDPAKVRGTPGGQKKGAGRSTGLIERRGEVVPLVDLAEAFDLPPRGGLAKQAVLVRRNGEPMAFALDKVRGQQEAVVRPLIDPLVQVPGVSGATDLGDGRPTLVLDLISLSHALVSRQGEEAA
jgi:two-component system, chemotaxis family, sensor kinase CheA